MKENEVIRVEDLDFTIETSKILSQVSLSVSKNEFVGLIGPNGSGKSTILKNIYRQYSPSSGAVYLNGKDIYRMKSKEVAQQMAVVAQENQESSLISLDEPTNHLDIGYQLYIMEIMRQFEDKTIFTSVHDMNLAARYCDRIILLQKGKIIANGTPEEVLTVEQIRSVFHVNTEIEKKNGVLNITYLGWTK